MLFGFANDVGPYRGRLVPSGGSEDEGSRLSIQEIVFWQRTLPFMSMHISHIDSNA